MNTFTEQQAKYLCMKNNPGKIVTIDPTTCEKGLM